MSAGPHRRTARVRPRDQRLPDRRRARSSRLRADRSTRPGRAERPAHGAAASLTAERQGRRDCAPGHVRLELAAATASAGVAAHAPAVDQGASLAEGVLVDVRLVRGVAISMSRGGNDVGPDRRSGAPAGSAGQGAPHGRMLPFAARPLIQPVAHLPHAHGNASARRNQSAAEMLWRSAVSIVKYSTDFRHVHIRFTMPACPIVDECVRKTTANSATDR